MLGSVFWRERRRRRGGEEEGRRGGGGKKEIGGEGEGGGGEEEKEEEGQTQSVTGGEEEEGAVCNPELKRPVSLQFPLPFLRRIRQFASFFWLRCTKVRSMPVTQNTSIPTS